MILSLILLLETKQDLVALILQRGKIQKQGVPTDGRYICVGLIELKNDNLTSSRVPDQKKGGDNGGKNKIEYLSIQFNSRAHL